LLIKGDSSTSVLDMESKCVVKLAGSDGDFIAFSEDSRLIVTHDPDRGVAFWDLSSGEHVHQFGAYGMPEKYANAWRSLAGYPLRVAALSHDARMIALEPLSPAAGTHTIEIRACPSGQLLGHLRGHDGKVNTVSFSADGKYAITGSEDCTALVWDLAEVMKRH